MPRSVDSMKQLDFYRIYHHFVILPQLYLSMAAQLKLVEPPVLLQAGEERAVVSPFPPARSPGSPPTVPHHCNQ